MSLRNAPARCNRAPNVRATPPSVLFWIAALAATVAGCDRYAHQQTQLSRMYWFLHPVAPVSPVPPVPVAVVATPISASVSIGGTTYAAPALRISTLTSIDRPGLPLPPPGWIRHASDFERTSTGEIIARNVWHTTQRPTAPIAPLSPAERRSRTRDRLFAVAVGTVIASVVAGLVVAAVASSPHGGSTYDSNVTSSAPTCPGVGVCASQQQSQWLNSLFNY